MKATQHVEHLLQQGHKPKELIDLGFPKQIITKVRRRLKEKKKALQPKGPKSKAEAESNLRSSLTLPPKTGPDKPRRGFLEAKVKELEARMEVFEALSTNLENLETRYDGTPGLGLKHRFECGCGASGFVAIRIQCTKCGRETWWGWFPKE